MWADSDIEVSAQSDKDVLETRLGQELLNKRVDRLSRLLLA
jgi:hypothetical protein